VELEQSHVNCVLKLPVQVAFRALGQVCVSELYIEATVLLPQD